MGYGRGEVLWGRGRKSRIKFTFFEQDSWNTGSLERVSRSRKVRPKCLTFKPSFGSDILRETGSRPRTSPVDFKSSGTRGRGGRRKKTLVKLKGTAERSGVFIFVSCKSIQTYSLLSSDTSYSYRVHHKPYLNFVFFYFTINRL